MALGCELLWCSSGQLDSAFENGASKRNDLPLSGLPEAGLQSPPEESAREEAFTGRRRFLVRFHVRHLRRAAGIAAAAAAAAAAQSIAVERCCQNGGGEIVCLSLMRQVV